MDPVGQRWAQSPQRMHFSSFLMMAPPGLQEGLRRNAVAIANQRIVALVALHLDQVDQAQAILRTHIHASGAQDALRAVENGVDLALQAAQTFGASLVPRRNPTPLRRYRCGGWPAAPAWSAAGFQKAARHLPVIEDAKAAQHGLRALAVEVDVNGTRRAMPVGYGFHQHTRSEGHVAAGKHARSGGHEVFVDLEDSARRHLNIFVAAEEGQVGLLADGEDHVVARNHLFFVAEGRVEAAVFIEDRDAGANLEPDDHAVRCPRSPSAPSRCPRRCLRVRLRGLRSATRASAGAIPG